jgi:hypothetical protein
MVAPSPGLSDSDPASNLDHRPEQPDQPSTAQSSVPLIPVNSNLYGSRDRSAGQSGGWPDSDSPSPPFPGRRPVKLTYRPPRPAHESDFDQRTPIPIPGQRVPGQCAEKTSINVATVRWFSTTPMCSEIVQFPPSHQSAPRKRGQSKDGLRFRHLSGRRLSTDSRRFRARESLKVPGKGVKMRASGSLPKGSHL